MKYILDIYIYLITLLFLMASMLLPKARISGVVLLFVASCIYSQYHIPTYFGATVPFLGHVDQIELLMRLGNRSVTNQRPVWRTHERFMTMCTMVKNEAKYVREWVEFHSLVGVDAFVIFDNDSTDSLADALHGTIANVTIIRWPPLKWPEGNPHQDLCEGYEAGTNRVEWAYCDCQIAAYHECIKNERGRSRWIAGVDVDEFYMPKYDEKRLHTLPEAMKEYDSMHGIMLTSFRYGIDHHQNPISANELMIETHTVRGEKDGIFKEFVDPLKVSTYWHVHFAHYYNWMWNLPFLKNIPKHRGTVRFNHYPFRSMKEGRHKVIKNMDPSITMNMKVSSEIDNIWDPYLIPMVPLVRRRLVGEQIWIASQALLG